MQSPAGAKEPEGLLILAPLRGWTCRTGLGVQGLTPLARFCTSLRDVSGFARVRAGIWEVRTENSLTHLQLAFPTYSFSSAVQFCTSVRGVENASSP